MNEYSERRRITGAVVGSSSGKLRNFTIKRNDNKKE
jgi:hypothetical protein